MNNTRLLAESDLTVLMHYRPRAKTFRYVVEVLKSRKDRPSIHGFTNLFDANMFMSDLYTRAV